MYKELFKEKRQIKIQVKNEIKSQVKKPVLDLLNTQVVEKVSGKAGESLWAKVYIQVRTQAFK
jgi:hypothetical protein